MMSRLSSLGWVALGSLATFLYAGVQLSGDVAAAQGKDEPKTIELHLLEKETGANFGDWVVWRHEEKKEDGIFLINQKTSLAIYFPWSSNGWINFRAKDGEWHLLYSKGEAEPQKRDDLQLAKFPGKRPTVNLQDGKYTFQEWTVKVTKDLIDFHNTFDDRMTIRRASGEVTHNGRTIGAKK